MPQSQYKSISELKFLARMQTGRNFGILLGILVLNLIISITAVNLIPSPHTGSNLTNYLVSYGLTFVIQTVVSVLDAGVAYAFLKTACNMTATVNDLFYGFKNHCTKFLTVGAIIVFIKSICLIPVEYASVQMTEIINSIPVLSEYSNLSSFNTMLASGSVSSSELLTAYSILYNAMIKFYLITIACTLVSTILTLPFFPAFYMILDFPEWTAGTVLKKCFEVMHGSKLRLFGLYLSFIPSIILSAFTCGLSLIWVIPYMEMSSTNFYLDLMAVRNKAINNHS